MRILHTADWHLDAPFSGASAGQREFLRQELLKIPEKILEIAKREHCDMILIAGDVFDGPHTLDSLQSLRRGLEAYGQPVFITPGNHDFCSPGSVWTELRWPENVHVFTGGMESVSLPELDCRVYGAGYQSMDCPALLEDFRCVGNEKYHIGVLHGDPGGASSPYCPVTTAQVRASGLSYLALGHIHKAGHFLAGDTLCAWPGCPMGRGFDETGDKGVYIVELDGQAQLRFVPLATPAFFDLQIDTTGGTFDALENALPGMETADVYRVTLIGSGQEPLTDICDRYTHIPNLLLRDNREAPADIWASAGEDTLEGVYFALLKELAESEDTLTQNCALLAAEISRKLLDGKEVRL